MIDYIKVKLTDRDLMLTNLVNDKDNHLVIGKYNHTIDEQQYPIRSKRENLFINVTEKGATIENSLHKFFNELAGNKSQNYNNFDSCDIQCALDILEQQTNYPLEKTIITNLEFGFNIEMDICPTKFLENNVLMYDFKSPCYDPKNDKGKKIKKFTYTEYEVKIYNKSLQYQLDKHILRVEIKYKSKKQLNRLGIYNLEDLKNPENMKTLLGDFFKKYENLLIVDSYNGNRLMSKIERGFVTLCSHPNYWIELKYNAHRNTIYKQKQKFLKLIKKFKLDSWKKQLKKDILSKFNELYIPECSNVPFAA